MSPRQAAHSSARRSSKPTPLSPKNEVMSNSSRRSAGPPPGLLEAFFQRVLRSAPIPTKSSDEERSRFGERNWASQSSKQHCEAGGDDQCPRQAEHAGGRHDAIQAARPRSAGWFAPTASARMTSCWANNQRISAGRPCTRSATSSIAWALMRASSLENSRSGSVGRGARRTPPSRPRAAPAQLRRGRCAGKYVAVLREKPSLYVSKLSPRTIPPPRKRVWSPFAQAHLATRS